MKELPLQTSVKWHLVVAVNISLWLVLFLILIAPFDVADLPFKIRLQIIPLYGLITFIVYMLLVPIQNWLFKKLKVWSVLLELAFVVSFIMLVFGGCYLYYISDVVRGDYSFQDFTFEIFFPILFIFLPILLFARWFLNKKVKTKSEDFIMLTGENKLDFLKLKFSDLICISSATNYVEVSYLKNTHLKTKLLRSTLSAIEKKTFGLLKVHRSHLINPIHFKEWKDSSTILVNEIEVPISKKYKQAVLEISNHP